jgi:hypothetical protein
MTSAGNGLVSIRVRSESEATSQATNSGLPQGG